MLLEKNHNQFFIKYMLIINLLKFLVSLEVIQCNNYMNNLNIICKKYEKKINGNIECVEFEATNLSDIISIPDECYNRKYNLDLLIENSNPPENQNFDLYIEKNDLINFSKNALNKFIKNNKEKIKNCTKYFIKFEELCSIKKNDEKGEKKCNEYLAKNKLSRFCYYIIIDMSVVYENTIIPRIKRDNALNNEKMENLIVDYYINNIKIENMENIIKNTIKHKEKKKKNYFDEPKNERNKFLDTDDEYNELETYYIKSRKDCVEYGLKSINEDIIICTKYE